jgi:hypothetical protein
MGERFVSFDANRSYLMGAIAQIDCGDSGGAFETLTRCHDDIDPEGLATPMDADDRDFVRYRKLDRVITKARDLISSDPGAARAGLMSGLKEFGWLDKLAAANAE